MEQLIFFTNLTGVAAVEAEQNVKTVKAQHWHIFRPIGCYLSFLHADGTRSMACVS